MQNIMGIKKKYTLERHRVIMESTDPEDTEDLREVNGWPN